MKRKKNRMDTELGRRGMLFSIRKKTRFFKKILFICLRERQIVTERVRERVQVGSVTE